MRLMQLRQGDVLLIATKPNAVTSEHRPVPRDAGRVVLAYGEVTGHAHVFRDPGVCLLSREGISDRAITGGVDIDSFLQQQGGGGAAPTALARPRSAPLARESVRAEALRTPDRVVTLEADCLLQHEEHDAILVPAGTYRVVIQREWRGQNDAAVDPRTGASSFVGD